MEDDTDMVLSRALAEAFGEDTPETKVETEAQPEVKAETPALLDDDDALTKTKLGRKVKRLEERMVTKDDFDVLLSEVRSFQKAKFSPEHQDPEYLRDPFEPDHDDEPVTVSKFKKLLSDVESEKQKQRIEYENRYLRRLREMMDDPDFEDMSDEIEKLVTGTDIRYNKTHSNYVNPESDLERNFAKAALDLAKTKRTEHQTAFQGRPAPSPTGTSGNSSPSKSATMPKLDDQTRAYIRSMGLTDDDVVELLSK